MTVKWNTQVCAELVFCFHTHDEVTSLVNLSKLNSVMLTVSTTVRKNLLVVVRWNAKNLFPASVPVMNKGIQLKYNSLYRERDNSGQY